MNGEMDWQMDWDIDWEGYRLGGISTGRDIDWEGYRLGGISTRCYGRAVDPAYIPTMTSNQRGKGTLSRWIYLLGDIPRKTYTGEYMDISRRRQIGWYIGEGDIWMGEYTKSQARA